MFFMPHSMPLPLWYSTLATVSVNKKQDNLYLQTNWMPCGLHHRLIYPKPRRIHGQQRLLVPHVIISSTRETANTFACEYMSFLFQNRE